MRPPTIIFDHLIDGPADQRRYFSQVAREMRASTRWVTVTPREIEPKPVHGQIEGK